MEGLVMFNLERELQKWRQEMAAPGLTPEIIAELEEHLRDDIERQVRSGIAAPDALQGALQRLGQPQALRHEFNVGSHHCTIVNALGRNKAKIVLCAAAGVLAATLFHVIRPTPYHSEAKLLIRYVVKTVSPAELDRVMNEQVEILTSVDLAREVAEHIGPSKILVTTDGDKDLIRAAAVIKAGLRVSVRPKSNLIHITFAYPESHLVQPVLREVIDRFLKLHVEKYRLGPPAFSMGKVSNISQIQSPSPPLFDLAAFFRMLGLVVGGCVFVGLAWVFALEFFCVHPGQRLSETG